MRRTWVDAVMVVTDGLPGIHAQVRTETGWVDFALVPEGFSVPDEDGLIVLRASAPPVRGGGRRLPTGDGEFIGVYERALVRVAVRFAEVNNIAVVLHWRGVPMRATAVAVAVAGWLRDTRAVTGQPAAVVTSAQRPRPEGGFIAVSHAVRLAGEPPASIWELCSRRAPSSSPQPVGDSGDEPPPGLTPADGPDDAAWVASWTIRPRPGSGTARVIRPRRRPGPDPGEEE
ncbi:MULTISPECIES: hypothetical protein [unclassified Pseudofrankia]|uniref:hypothetical protein n=1 Tax=unclassified Pseudofrankia TaxID=2994372 RepID=UPI001041E7EA|nr:MULTISPECIES: hypothetical protein [unclassified Pseudofrankia]MDT3442783.1 hypothetical protein [Pseudofrankia sp. BMG5.37]